MEGGVRRGKERRERPGVGGSGEVLELELALRRGGSRWLEAVVEGVGGRLEGFDVSALAFVARGPGA